MRALLYFVLLTLLVKPSICWADSPLPQPRQETICSPNGRFCAVSDPATGTTTVYAVPIRGKGKKSWAMAGCFRVFHVADDGEHLVTGYDGMNLLALDYTKKEVMIRFFKRGKLIRTVTLQQLLSMGMKLERTVSHYAWGNSIGFDRKGRYLVDLQGGGTIAFNAATGRRVPL